MWASPVSTLTGGLLCPRSRITDDKIDAFVNVMRANVLTGATRFRRAYIRSVTTRLRWMTPKYGFTAATPCSNGWSWVAALSRPECPVLFASGAPEEIRTPEPQIRSLTC